jgi:hypothetical protein
MSLREQSQVERMLRSSERWRKSRRKHNPLLQNKQTNDSHGFCDRHDTCYDFVDNFYQYTGTKQRDNAFENAARLPFRASPKGHKG